MKSKCLVLAMLLAISLTIPAFINTTRAVPVPANGTNTKYIEWIPEGYTFYTDIGKGFGEQPEFLKLTVEAAVPVITPTTITIQGTDALGQPIRAQVFIPGTSLVPIEQETEYVFIDPHSGCPVAFSGITSIIQQGGTDGNKFLISTVPESEFFTQLPFTPGVEFVPAPYFEQYMGEYELQVQQQTGQGWQPGIYKWDKVYDRTLPYWITMGIGISPLHISFPFEPLLPEPITVYVNWHDQNHDLVPKDSFMGIPDDFGAVHAGTIYIEGLNARGEKLILSHTFNAGDLPYYTWDCLCEIDKMWGGSQSDSYYVFTTPPRTVDLFYYFISIDHLTIHPESYDILAYPNEAGTTEITVALRDVDGNLVNWGGTFANATFSRIFLSFYSSGGHIFPSYDIWIGEEECVAHVHILADTNPRTIKVVCDANVPQVDKGDHLFHNQLNLMTWTEMTFDGVNLVPPTAPWPIHTLVWGYDDAQGTPFTLNAPAEPALPPELGGPALDGMKLDGPIYEITINLYPGCNLISSPVYLLFGPRQYALPGIPMGWLFGMTSARDCIEAVWWYEDGKWMSYIPLRDNTEGDGPYFTDGVGYWIKAEKPCVLEISGVAMENAPFTPKEYPVHHSWNLMGFTSIGQMNTADYLESLATGTSATGPIASAVGPIWTYDAKSRSWTRDPAMLWPTNAFWMNYKLPDGAHLSP